MMKVCFFAQVTSKKKNSVFFPEGAAFDAQLESVEEMIVRIPAV